MSQVPGSDTPHPPKGRGGVGWGRVSPSGVEWGGVGVGWWCGVCARVCAVLLAGDGSAKEQPRQVRSRLHNQFQKHQTCNPTCKYHGFLSIDSSLNICFEERISPQMQSGQDFNNPFTNHTHYPPHTHRGGAGGPSNSTHPPTPTGGGGGGPYPCGGGGLPGPGSYIYTRTLLIG